MEVLGLNDVGPVPVLPPPEQFLGTLDQVAAVGSSLDNSVQVPAERLIMDTDELELVGDGLPIIHGEEWPEVYWKALQKMGSKQAVDVPVPHPKFTMKDMQRIASTGPQFGDLVLEHVEASAPLEDEKGAPVASARSYNYVPFTVLGDYQYEPEPNWLELGTTRTLR